MNAYSIYLSPKHLAIPLSKIDYMEIKKSVLKDKNLWLLQLFSILVWLIKIVANFIIIAPGLLLVFTLLFGYYEPITLLELVNAISSLTPAELSIFTGNIISTVPIFIVLFVGFSLAFNQLPESKFNDEIKRRVLINLEIAPETINLKNMYIDKIHSKSV